MLKVVDYTEKVKSEALMLPLSYMDKAVALEDEVLVIGIASGGLPISHDLYHQLKVRGYKKCHHAEIKCQRPSTKIKKKNISRERKIKALFRITPKPILNLLRIIEHKFLSLKDRDLSSRTVELNFEKMKEISPRIIIIVDDAVDSGMSLKAVFDHVTQLFERPNGSVIIKTFSIAVTQNNPMITPDFYWSKNVLVRFPWSLDAK